MWAIKNKNGICYGCGLFRSEFAAQTYINEEMGMVDYFEYEPVELVEK